MDQLHEKLKGLSVAEKENQLDMEAGVPVTEEKEEDILAEGIWLGRVEPKHVEAIIDEVILKGKVFKDLYRGGLPSKYANLHF